MRSTLGTLFSFRLWTAALSLLCVPAAEAALSATFNAATDVPLTTASYTPSGDVTFTLNYAPTPGTNLTVVRNTGPAFIQGTFSNLANGQTVHLTHGSTIYPFVAWYYGGDRNKDLVLLWPTTMMSGWGSNSGKKLTEASIPSPGLSYPGLVDGAGLLAGKTVVQVSMGASHTLALTTEGKVYSWGSNYYGQLGRFETSSYGSPAEVNTTPGSSYLSGKTVVAVSAGSNHSLALCSDGTVCSWGSNNSCQLGRDDGWMSSPPSNVPGAVDVDPTPPLGSALAGKTVTAIVAGTRASYALCSDGTMAAWGNNQFGQLGTGARTSPTLNIWAVSTAPGQSALAGKTVVAISAGEVHTLALCSDGTLAAWGGNLYHALGDGTGTDSPFPVTVAADATSALSGKTVTAISAGGYHNLALCSDGKIVSWGYHGDGVLGIGSASAPSKPVMVNTQEGTSALFGKTVTGIAASSAHNLALCSDGIVVAWGSNVGRQLGINSSAFFSNVPVLVDTGAGRSALAGQPVSRLATLSSDFSTSDFDGSSMVIIPGGPNDMHVVARIPLKPNGYIHVGIADGDTTPDLADLTDFGGVQAQPTPGTIERTFYIVNQGLEPLDLTGDPLVTLSGPGAADFAVITQPNTARVLRQSFIPFTIRFSPSAPGIRTAVLTISSSDTDEATYDFVIRAVGLGAEIDVQESGTTVAHESTIDFGTLGSGGGAVTKTLVIHNTGTVDLTGINVARQGLTPDVFTLLSLPASTVAPGESTSFTVRASVTSTGAKSAILTISNNDPDENDYEIHLTAEGVPGVMPQVTKPSVTAITADGVTFQGTVNTKGTVQTIVFDYGVTSTYGSTAVVMPDPMTSDDFVPVSAVVTGLLPNTKYHYRLRSSGALGFAASLTGTFTTLNRLPVAQNDTFTALPSGKIVLPVLTNDVDPGEVLSIASFTQPAGRAGTVAKAGNTLVFTPSVTFAGTTFTYVAGDGFRGRSAPATVTLSLGECTIGPDVTIPADSPPYALAVTANAPFGVIENASWLSFVPLAANATSVTFIPSPNASKTPRTAIVMVGGKTHTVTQSGVSELPVLTVPAPIPQAAISANYELAIPTQNGPVTYITTGMPKGLTLSNVTGKITGYPTEAKTSTVTVKAKNVQGDSNSISFDITVLDIPASVVGSFSALVEDDTSLTDKLGGFMTMTVTKTGGVTGTLKLGAGSHPFTGRLNTAENPATPDPVHAVLRTSVKRAGKPNVELLVRMNNDENDLITGEVTLPGAQPVSLELEGSRHVWDARTKPADNYKGYFTVALQPTSTAADIPQGDGFLTFTVTPAGAVSWSGQLADGTVITAQTCTLWADGRVPLFIVFGKGLGSLSQSLTISSTTRAVTGPLRWHKKSQVVRAYADGFVESITLQASGGKYLPPGTGKTLLDLTAPASYGLDFLDGGINNVANFADLDQTLTLSSKHVPTTSGANPAQVKLTKIDLTKGTFTGTLTLKDANPFNESLPQISRPVTFQGVIVSSLQMGTGYFLLPTISGPPANVTKSAMTSGQVRIQPLAP